MTAAVQCFLLEPSGQVRRYLRRYASNPPPCAEVGGYHDARVLLEQGDRVPDEVVSWAPSAEELAHPQWPTHCACRYAFTHNDYWQLFIEDLWRLPDGSLVELRAAPPGAMWRAPWLQNSWRRAPDGVCLLVRCPGGDDWLIDGPATNGPGWTRTGTPPCLTVEPSIQTSNYHGHLRDGVFTPA